MKYFNLEKPHGINLFLKKNGMKRNIEKKIEILLHRSLEVKVESLLVQNYDL